MHENAAKLEKRRSFIINCAYFAVIIGIGYVFFKYAFSAIAPFLIAFFIAACLQKPINAIEKKYPSANHTFVSIASFVLLLLIVLGPLATLLGALINEITKFVKYIFDSFNDIPQFIENIQNGILKFIAFLPDTLYDAVAKPLIHFFDDLQLDFDLSKIGLTFDNIKNSISGIVGAAKGIPTVVVAVVLSVIAGLFFTKDYRAVVNFINKQMPEKKRSLLPEIKRILFSTVGKMARAYAIIMSITFFELFIGLSLLKLFNIYTGDYILVIALFTSFFDILPVLGAGGILIPWALYYLVTGNFKMAIGLMLIYLFIYLFRQYLEPKIVGDQLGVHPLITLVGLFIGLKLFGFIGMIAVPFAIMMFKALNDAGTIHMWKSSIEAETPEKYKKKKDKKSLFSKLKSIKKQ